MKLQIIEDSNGKPAGVFIPIKEWNALKKQYKDLAALENNEPEKESLLQELKSAIAELKAIEEGQLQARPAKELLDEL